MKTSMIPWSAHRAAALAAGLALGLAETLVLAQAPTTPVPLAPAPAPAAQAPAAPPHAAPAKVTPAPAQPLPAFASRVRVSALIETADGVRVGLTEPTTQYSRLVGVGDTFLGIKIVSADYAKEEIVLMKGGERATVRLEGVATAPARVMPVADLPKNPEWHGAGIESFVQQYSNATLKTAISFKELQERLRFAPPEGKSIQDYMNENPALAEKLRRPAVGLGEGIESVIRENPALATNISQTTTGRLGPGIEAVLQQNPALATNLSRTGGPRGWGIEEAARQLQAQGTNAVPPPQPLPGPASN